MFRRHREAARAAGYCLHIFFGVCILLVLSDPVASIISTMPIVFGFIGLFRQLRGAAARRRAASVTAAGTVVPAVTPPTP